VLVEWAVLAVPVVLAALAVSVALVVLAVPVVPANLSGNTIRPIEAVLLMGIVLRQTNSAAQRAVIH
jgi:hypothetical protein